MQPSLSDKTLIQGQLCTAEPSDLQLPRKILFIMDQSASLDDPDGKDPTHMYLGYPSNGRQEAARSVVNAFLADDAVFFGFVYFNDNAWRCPSNRYFGQGDMDPCLSQLIYGDSITNMYKALRLAYEVIFSDLSQMDERLRRRTSYEIVFFADGAPNADGWPAWPTHPHEEKELLLDLVDDLMRLTLPTNGNAAQVRLHTVFLSVDSDPTDAEHLRSLDLMESMAMRGGGEFVDTPDPNQLNFLDLIQTRISPMITVKSFMAFNPFVHNWPEGPKLDSDGDGLTDEQETTLGLNPHLRDSDGDGCSDKVEILARYNPQLKDCPCATGLLDSDGDGLSDCDELVLGTDPENFDTDGDGIPDWIEVWAGTNPLVEDSELDSDGDGVNNAMEIIRGTSPIHPDRKDAKGYSYRYEFTNRRILEDRRECVDFKVSNVRLGMTLPSDSNGNIRGSNILTVLASTIPKSVPDDLGNWKVKYLDARYLGATLKEPVDGFYIRDFEFQDK